MVENAEWVEMAYFLGRLLFVSCAFISTALFVRDAAVIGGIASFPADGSKDTGGGIGAPTSASTTFPGDGSKDTGRGDSAGVSCRMNASSISVSSTANGSSRLSLVSSTVLVLCRRCRE